MKTIKFNHKHFMKYIFTFFILFSTFAFAENGLIGKYYTNKNFTGLECEKVDKIINFDWERGSPTQCPQVGRDDFSVIWNGYLKVPQDGYYRFLIKHDDGAKLLIDNIKLYDNRGWSGNNYRTSREQYLTTGFHKIQLYYTEGGGDAEISLGWGIHNQQAKIIASEYLFTQKESIKIKADSVSVYEGEIAKVKLYVEGDIPNGKSVKVNYQTQDDTAKDGINYTQERGYTTFTSTKKEHFVNIQTHEAGIQNTQPLNFKLNYQAEKQSGLVSSTNGFTNIEIKKKVELNVGFSSSNYKGEEGESIDFIVTLNRQSDRDFTIKYKTKNGTAVANSDYNARSGTLSFKKGDTQKHITIALNTDQLDEEDEYFYVELSSDQNTPFIRQKTAKGFIKGKKGIEDDENVIDEEKYLYCNKEGKCKSVNLQKEFKLRFGGPGYAAYGDMTATGESVMCPGSRGSCDWDSTTNVEDQPTTKLNEANFAINSSYAPLILPKEVNKGKHIIFARLYWQGFISNRDASEKYDLKQQIKGWSKIKFQTPDGEIHKLGAKKEDTNWLGYWGYGGRFAYQASVDVTSIIKNYMDSTIFQTTNNKRFAAGDIVATTEGADSNMVFHSLRNQGFTESTWGHWGGWALVVVYDMQRPIKNIKYKNVAIYDGMSFLTPWTDQHKDKIEIGVSGFYTPPSGDIDASMTLFSGSGAGPRHFSEGYLRLYDPKTDNLHEVYNRLNPRGQPANGSYTYKDKPLNENRPNHAATDLDTFDVSDFMSNSQSSARLEFEAYFKNRHGYTSMPSMLAFTTEIYSPKICYEEHTYYKNKEVPYEIVPVVGSMVNTKIEIRNEGFEDAQKIHFYTAFDQNYSYTDNSLLVGKTDPNTGVAQKPPIPNSNLASIYKPNEFNDANISVFIGRGASSVEGGTFNAMKQLKPYIGDSALIEYNMTFNDPDFKVRKYYAEYVNDLLKLKYKGQIFECIDTDRNFKAGILGDFNAVSQKVTEVISKEIDDPKNSLYTQIAGFPFNTWIVHLKNSGSKKELSKYTGRVWIDLVPSIDYTRCKKNGSESYDEDCVEQLCKQASGTNPISLYFNNEDQKELSLTIPYASATLMFRMKYRSENDKLQCTTSLDNFSIRPETYKIKLFDRMTGAETTTNFKGGKDYKLEATAVSKDTKTYGYNASAVKLSIDSDFVATCTLPAIHDSALLSFNDGDIIPPAGVITSNIGDFKLKITDDSWTATDQSPKSDGSKDCISGSYSNAPQNGKVGCSTQYEGSYLFIESKFRSKMYLQNADTINNFTYISNNPAMMATIRADFEALLDNNAIATGYDKNCYANIIEYDVNLNGAIADWTRATTAQADIHYNSSADPFTNITTPVDANPITVRTKAEAFTNGVANPKIEFNFVRNINVEDNPFTVTRVNFAFPRVIDTVYTAVSSIPVIDPVIPAANEDIAFYFGRVWAPDIRGESPITNSLRYEIFCNACNTTPYPLGAGNANPISNNWRLNTLHINTQGVVNNLQSLAPSGKGSTIVRNGPANTIVNGFENNVVLSANQNPTYTDVIQIQSSNWLRGQDDRFDITYIGGPRWSGKGQLGDVLNDTDAPTRSNNRVNW